MIFGIDLGTTNSLISLHNKFISSIVPSIANMTTHKAGVSEKENYDTLRRFKTCMSSDMAGAEAIVASSYVLSEVRNCPEVIAMGISPNDPMDAVISVPAYFNNSQRAATIKAAKLANINVKALINEPTAAAIAITKDADGTSFIFDLGGGTFDISIIRKENGKYSVLATDGCVLGGNDFDASLRDALSMSTGLKWRVAGDNRVRDIVAEAKIKMQNIFNCQKPVPVDFDDYGVQGILTYEMYDSCMKSTFNKALLLTKNVAKEAHVDFGSANFYFVGGSTRCPFLRQWICDSLSIDAPEVDYNPDDIVAEGAGYYADLIEHGVASEVVSDVSKMIGFARDENLIEVVIPKNAPIPYSHVSTYLADNTEPIDTLHLDFYQGDSILVEDCDKLGDIDFKFSEVKQPGEAIYDVDINIDINGLVTVAISEVLGEPQVMTMEVIK